MGKNITNDYFKSVKKNINEYLELIMGDKYNKKLTLSYINSYMEIRYYNYEGVSNVKGSIYSYIKENSDVDIGDNVSSLLLFFRELFYLDTFSSEEELKTRINSINNLRIQKLGINEKGFNNKLLKLVMANNNKRDKILSNCNSDDFDLVTIKTNLKKVFDTDIKYNISFNSLYSDGAILNAFKTGLVNEERMSLLYYLYSLMALKSIILGDFNNNYLVDFDTSLFEKKKKFNSTLNILDSEPIKDITSLKITYSDFIKFKDEIYDLRRDGYNFAIIIDNEYVDNEVEFTKLQLFKYVIINNEEYKYDSLMKLNNIVLV